MKKNILLLFIFLNSINLFSQSRNQLICEHHIPKTREEFETNQFQGITQLKYYFENSDLVLDKNFKIIIREYKSGKLFSEKIAIDTKAEELPSIDKDFKFTLMSQHILDNQKIGFFFNNFMNKRIYQVDKNFPDGTYDLRDLTGNTNKLDFEIGKEMQIALITPPNENPKAGNLGYCEVSKGNINIDFWYKKYKIPQFFLIYFIVE